MAKGKRVLTMEAEKLTPWESFRLDLYYWLQALVLALTALILLFTLVGRIIGVDGESMVPTLHHGDMLLLQSLGYTPEQGDVVVLTKPFGTVKGPIVKRVIATAGQTVDIDYDAGMVYVDGAPLDEPYINEVMYEPFYEDLSHVEVPEGHIFVMGDNRNHSDDSRDAELGSVDVRCVIGGARLILLPPRDFGIIE